MDNSEAASIRAAAQSGTAESGTFQPAQPSTDIRATPRRRILAAGFAGVATSLLPWLNGRVSASASTTPDTDTAPTDDTSGDPFAPDTDNASDVSTGSTDAGTDLTDPAGDPDDTQAPTGGPTSDSAGTEATEAATTTTAAPKRPTAADIELLDFAQSVELTVRDLYDVAIDGNVFEGLAFADITAIREAHEGYATSIAGLIGRNASNTAIGALFGQMQAGFTGDAETVAAAAAGLEDTAVATHIDIIGQLIGVDGAALIASIAVIEARHATLLKVMAGVVDLADQLATDGEALLPADFTVE